VAVLGILSYVYVGVINLIGKAIADWGLEVSGRTPIGYKGKEAR